jgi:hypothetical protein
MVKRSRSRKVSRREHFSSCGSHLLGGKRKSVKSKKGKGKKSKKDTKSSKQSCLQKMNEPKLMLYCLKCKQKRLVSKNGRQCVKTKNNRDMIKAMCSVCGAKCHQFV